MTHPIQTLSTSMGLAVRSYSGRGMYGKSCLGVELNESYGNSVIANFTSLILDRLSHSGLSRDVLIIEMREIANAFGMMAWDSLGKGTIVYFPGIFYEREEKAQASHEES